MYQTEIARPTGVASLDATIPGNLMLAQDGYALWDAGLVWTSADRKIQVGLHGRNLPDKRYKMAGYNFSELLQHRHRVLRRPAHRARHARREVLIRSGRRPDGATGSAGSRAPTPSCVKHHNGVHVQLH